MYESVEDLKRTLIGDCKVRLFYKSNEIESETESVLLSLFDNACKIITSWRKLKDNSEFLQGKWDSEIVQYIIDAYNSLNEEIIAVKSDGSSKITYAFNAEAALKGKIPQRLF